MLQYRIIGRCRPCCLAESGIRRCNTYGMALPRRAAEGLGRREMQVQSVALAPCLPMSRCTEEGAMGQEAWGLQFDNLILVNLPVAVEEGAGVHALLSGQLQLVDGKPLVGTGNEQLFAVYHDVAGTGTGAAA